MKYYLWMAQRWIYQKFWMLTHFWMYFKPERYIPKDTEYCYGVVNYNKENGTLTCNYCPFHKHLGMDLCMLDGNDCCGDSVKWCGINCPDDEEYMMY